MPTQSSPDEPAVSDQSAVPESAAPEPAPAEPDDTRARFRAALERKRSRNTAGGHGSVGESKIHGAHGAAGGHRMFRRKSG